MKLEVDKVVLVFKLTWRSIRPVMNKITMQTFSFWMVYYKAIVEKYVVLGMSQIIWT